MLSSEKRRFERFGRAIGKNCNEEFSDRTDNQKRSSLMRSERGAHKAD